MEKKEIELPSFIKRGFKLFGEEGAGSLEDKFLGKILEERKNLDLEALNKMEKPKVHWILSKKAQDLAWGSIKEHLEEQNEGSQLKERYGEFWRKASPDFINVDTVRNLFGL